MNSDDFFLGESPPLPPSLIVDLKDQMTERLWAVVARLFSEGVSRLI